jgi:large subunit ribosomal protein L2
VLNDLFLLKTKGLLKFNIKRLKSWGKKFSGRNNSGKITVRHIGGGSAPKLYFIDLRRRLSGQWGYVIGFEVNSYNSQKCPLALIYVVDLGIYIYILAASGLKVWDVVYFNYYLIDYDESEIGSSGILMDLPVNTEVFNIESKVFCGGQLAKAAGKFGTIVRRYTSISGQSIVQIKLPSKKYFYVSGSCVATIGKAASLQLKLKKYRKAGQLRHKGCRPIVRGVAMNPVDHPHGGATSGGRISVSAWGKKTKGLKTLDQLKRKKLKKFVKRFNRSQF